MKQWKMASPSSETVALLCREQIPPLTAHLLAVRRITTVEAARNFLRGDDELSDPFLLQDMDKAVERIGRAVEEGRKSVFTVITTATVSPRQFCFIPICKALAQMCSFIFLTGIGRAMA